MLKKFDMFGAPLPTFNNQGESKVNTYAGCILSLVVLTVTILFSLVKLRHLAARQNPFVNTYVRRDAYGESDVFKTSDNGFMMAFTLQDYITGEIKDDARYMKWFAEYTTVSPEGQTTTREVSVSPCTAADFERFETPERRSRKRFEALKA